MLGATVLNVPTMQPASKSSVLALALVQSGVFSRFYDYQLRELLIFEFSPSPLASGIITTTHDPTDSASSSIWLNSGSLIPVLNSGVTGLERMLLFKSSGYSFIGLAEQSKALTSPQVVRSIHSGVHRIYVDRICRS